jgi:hypothetical protein
VKNVATKEAFAVSIQMLWSTKETAGRLRVSEVTVIRLHDQGLLKGVVIAQRARKRILRFRPETVEKFIASRER